MPRVLRIINRFNLGGPTYNVGYLTKYLAPEFETLLVGGDKEEGEDSSTFILDQLGVKPVIIPEIRREIGFSEDRKAYKKLKDIIADFKPDIVHTHASKAGALGRLAAANMKVPVIVHTFHGHVFHSYFGGAKTTFYKLVERYLASKSDAIIAISPLQKNELVNIHKIAGNEKVKIIPLGFDLSRFTSDTTALRSAFRKEYAVDDDEIVINIIGRLAPVKNHNFFIRLIAETLKSTNKKIRAFIVGDGELKTVIQDAATAAGIQWTANKEHAQLNFTSWIKNIEYALAGSDIVCLTSDNEGTPVSLIEAQAAGKVVLATDVGGVRDVIGDVIGPGCGSVSPKGDLAGMKADLLRFIESPDLRAEAAQSGPSFAMKHFHYSRLVNDVRELYFSLLNRK
jgi:glycosyltransferase involved in cell wall biosynthesis